jgi:hypothetical protein
MSNSLVSRLSICGGISTPFKTLQARREMEAGWKGNVDTTCNVETKKKGTFSLNKPKN